MDPRFSLKVLRGLPALRKRVDAQSLAEVVESTYPDSQDKQDLLTAIGGNAGQKQATVAAASKKKPATRSSSKASAVHTGTSTPAGSNSPSSLPIPEIDTYIHLIVLVWILNGKDDRDKADVTPDLDLASRFAQHCIDRLRNYNRRSLDYLSAKMWFYYARCAELLNQSAVIVPTLLLALRTATLRHDDEVQASLITLLLRSYLASHKVTQAANLVGKTTFPANASNALAARYLYYLGRISAIQLDYSSAHEQVTAAIRKAPQTPHALGFLQAAHKLRIVVELLMGDIPDRAIFRERSNERALAPYLDVTRAVRLGDLNQFSATLAKHEKALKKDGTYTLVLRLRQNVIKTGIRIMSLTYSKITLRDICLRLHLGSEESAEYVVAKAIRDGVIDATIEHEQGYMKSNEVVDVYSTSEPQTTFHERIKFCIDLHNDSVKSMRYMMNDHRVDLKSMEEAREREKELATEIQDLDDTDADFDM